MKILLAIDGSRCSTEAALTLADRRWPNGTAIKLVTVIKRADPFNRVHDEYEREEMRYRVEEALNQLASKLKERLPDCIFACEIFEGDAPEEILTEAKAWPCDLIVVGCHGRRGLERVLLGSVSQAISMRAPCPVFVVKSRQHDVRTRLVKRIIVAIDNADCSVPVLEWISRLPWKDDTEILLLSVVDSVIERYSAETNVLKAADLLNKWQNKQSKNIRVLKSLVKKVKKITGICNVNCRLSSGDPSQMIVSEAGDWQADLIVMGSHGRTGLALMLMGSVAQAVLKDARCSVEIVRTYRARTNIDTALDTDDPINTIDDLAENYSHSIPSGLI